MATRQAVLIKRLAEHVARRASMLSQKYELSDLVPLSVAVTLDKAFERLVSAVARRNGGLWCGMCDRGPFTKRGFYLHLMRVHVKDLEYLVQEELKKALDSANRRPQ